MTSVLAKVLGLSAKDQQSIGKTTGKIKSVAEFVADAVKALKDTHWLTRLSEACPWWLHAVGEATATAAPPVKFIAALVGKLGEIRDPDQLAFLAFTTAYQRAVEKGLRAVGAPKCLSGAPSWKPSKDVKTPAEGMTFAAYSLRDPLNHEFLREAGGLLESALQAAGYDDNERRRIHNEVAMRFPGTLKSLLTHPATRERFLSLADALRLDTKDERIRAAWDDHFEYLRYLFEDKPVFGEEPFALADVYVETQCGVLCWKDVVEPGGDREPHPGQAVPQGSALPDRRRADAFSLKEGGAHDMVSAVMELLGDRTFRDAIVVQGAAGSGKSAFTLRLCAELLRRGLRPIRVRFRDLPLHAGNIMDALPEAVRFWDLEDPRNEPPKARPEDLFDEGNIFDHHVELGGCRISPWVIILDGWDEVSVAAERGFAVRVGEILAQVRDRFLNRGNRPLVRVILTGRPSEAVAGSSFMTRETRVLTVRPLEPGALRAFVGRLAGRLADPKEPDKAAPGRFEPVLKEYEGAYQKVLEEGQPDGPSEKHRNDSMEVLGLPLLAHLAVRLMVRWPDADLQPLVADPTALYRHLTNLTCEKGGRYGQEVHQPPLAGQDLRRLLHESAAAMTIFGRDHIPYDELDCRLSSLDEDLVDRVGEVTKDHPVTSLMISFFFKGGHKELGAEFLHKSFREYLFAECIVEALKGYGRKARPDLPERNPYWKDFDPGNPEDRRFDLSRQLGRLLAPQWITLEVARYLHGLIAWELARSHGLAEGISVGNPTEKLDLDAWARVRDALADLWDWWGEGVHLRQQPRLRRKMRTEWDPPFVEELVEWALPQAPQRDEIPVAPRSVTLDGHLGDGLCRLAALVHHYVAVPPGSMPAWGVAKGPPADIRVRRYQSLAPMGNQWKVRFRPSGPDASYFMNFAARINAAGWHPGRWFPGGLFLASVDFDDIVLMGSFLSGTNLVGASLRGTNFFHTVMAEADFRGSFCQGAWFHGTGLEGANFERANLDGTWFRHANLRSSRFDAENAREVMTFSNCLLEGAQGIPSEKVTVSQQESEPAPPGSDEQT